MSAARWLLGVAVLVALSHLPAQLGALRGSLPLLRLWATPDAQQRLQLGALPYDLLRATDAALPRDATLLLVTSGDDVRHLEYTTFHRALYFLAPRPVWWLSPAPPDGTWEARWWLSAPLTPQSICATARARGATHLLLLAPVEALPCVTGSALLELSGGTVLPLAGQLAPVAAPAPLAPPTLWPLRLLMGVGSLILFGSALLGIIGYRAGLVERLSLAWALGSGAATLGMAGLGALGLRLPGQVALLSLLALGGALWQRRRALTPAPPRPPAERSRPTLLVAWLLAGYLLLQICPRGARRAGATPVGVG